MFTSPHATHTRPQAPARRPALTSVPLGPCDDDRRPDAVHRMRRQLDAASPAATDHRGDARFRRRDRCRTAGYRSETAEVDLFDSSVVHTISVDFDQADYDAMIDTFVSTGEKEWISATVTIDGVSYENVGLRLKGNSSLFGLTSATSGNPDDLPWLIRLDEFVEGEDHQDYEDIVIRSNSTETAMNEAVAQELLSLAGLASQDPIATAFTVNGGETELRFAVENPDEEWYEDNFTDEDGLLYKADSEGDYSYRGDDAEAYIDVFDQKVGDDDMAPLIDFLDFVNNADDATFATELGDRLDVEAFATYLAFQDLIGNADDINGRGNNSYPPVRHDDRTIHRRLLGSEPRLRYRKRRGAGGGGAVGEVGDAAGGPVAGGGGRPGGVGGRPAGPLPDAAGDAVAVGGGRGWSRGSRRSGQCPGRPVHGGCGLRCAVHIEATEELHEQLFASGTVDEVIANWADLLINGASISSPRATVAAEVAALIGYVDGMR